MNLIENMSDVIENIVEASAVLESLLTAVPFVSGITVQQEVLLDNARRADFITAINIGNQQLRLVGEFKQHIQPRYVLDVVRQVKEYCTLLNETAYPVVISDYISPRSAEILINENVSYFDLVGNCRLCFANVYIEKVGKKSRRGERRGVKSLFGLKSSRMLRLMLNNPVRPWQVTELATGAELSLGQVSNIRRALLDQHYAIESEAGGFYINQPAALLEQWKNTYKKNIVNNANFFYTLLSPEDRLEAIKKATAEARASNAGLMLGSLSAAKWLAPYVRSSSEYFYADSAGMVILKKYLALEPVGAGANIIIEEPKDPFVFKEAIECAPGLNCTDVVQTCLDLFVLGERENEAAEYLATNVLKEQWNKRSG